MNDDRLIPSTFFLVFFLFLVLLFIISLVSIPLRTRASSNTLTLKIKVQGIRKNNDQIKSRIDFYNGPAKAFEETDVTFTHKDGVFTADVTLKSEFNFSDRYALFIKPEKFVGQVFCNQELKGTACKTPAFIFLPAGSTVDLTKYLFFTGDIPPANGKVDAGDMSNIMKQLGKVATATESATDLNSDGLTDVTDYSLALYALSNNAADDPVSLQSPSAPTATPAPSATPAITPSAAPTATTAPTPTTPAPTSTPVPTATRAPTPTIAPTATTAPTPTTAAAGVCHLLPGSMAKSFCGMEPEDLAASASFTECISGGEGMCAGSSKARCTCATGTCTCQLKDEATQTVSCTNGGKIEIIECK